MLQLLDAKIASQQNGVVIDHRIPRGMDLRGKPIATVGGVRRAPGEAGGGAVLRGSGADGEIGVSVGQSGGNGSRWRRWLLGVEENAGDWLLGELLGKEITVDSFGVLRRTPGTQFGEIIVFFRTLHAESRLRNLLSWCGFATVVALGCQENFKKYDGSRLLSRTFGASYNAVLNISSAEIDILSLLKNRDRFLYLAFL